MSTCFQHSTQNMLEHGVAVHDTYRALIGALSSDCQHPPAEICIPDWLWANRDALLDRLLPLDLMQAYHWYHDCGKPACRTVDAEGRQHFPEHATRSEQEWLNTGGDTRVGRLIGMDMLLHTASADAMVAFAWLPEAASLLMTAFAEIHANASLFGGTESTNFKVKYKHLDRRGKALVRAWEAIMA
jgi:hypothetical protein